LQRIKGFRRARDYGFLHSNSKPLIQLLQYLFHCCVISPPRPAKKSPIACRACGGIMQVIATGIRRWSQLEPAPQPT